MPFDAAHYEQQDPRVAFIDAVLERLGPAGEWWCQGRLVDSSGAVCLEGAIYAVANGNPCDTRLEMNSAAHAVYSELESRLGFYPRISAFNDVPWRRFRGIRRLLRKTRKHFVKESQNAI